MISSTPINKRMQHMTFEELLNSMENKEDVRYIKVQMSKISRATGLSHDEVMSRATNLAIDNSLRYDGDIHVPYDDDLVKREVDFFKKQQEKHSRTRAEKRIDDSPSL